MRSRPLTPAPPITIAALATSILAASCAAPAKSEWRYSNYDSAKTNAYPSSIDSFGSPELLADVEIGVAPGNRRSLLIGDVAASRAPEIIIVDTDRISILTLRGKSIAKISFSRCNVAAGFLADFDGDGKSDIVLGTIDTSPPAIRVMNGAGHEIAAIREARYDTDFLELMPIELRSGLLTVFARQRWAESVRGIAAYRPPKLLPEWEFVVPFDPIGVTVRSTRDGAIRYLVSQFTTTSGTYPYLGTDRAEIYGIDAMLHVVELDPDGTLTALAPIVVDGAMLRGSGWFHPLPDRPGARNHALLIHEGTIGKPFGDETHTISVVEIETGRVTAFAEFASAVSLEVRLFRTGADEGSILVLESGTTTSTLHLLALPHSEAAPPETAAVPPFATIRKLAFAAEFATLGPVLTDPEGDSDRFLVIRDEILALYNDRLEELFAHPIRPAREIAYVERRNDAIVALLGEHLQVFSIPEK